MQQALDACSNPTITGRTTLRQRWAGRDNKKARITAGLNNLKFQGLVLHRDYWIEGFLRILVSRSKVLDKRKNRS